MRKKKIFRLYKEYFKEDPRLLKIMKQLQVDQESYLNALYQIEDNKIIPDRIYSDSTA